MARYTVVFEGVRYGMLDVEASSEEEARAVAEDRLVDLALSDWYESGPAGVVSVEERPGE